MRAAIACVAALVAACAEPVPPARPNLLLVTVDTLRPDRLACYGGPAGVGTAICALAEHGIRYEWAFATAPTTSPSVASMLTSVYPSEHRVSQRADSALAEEAVTLAEVLHANGYATAAFVSNPVLDGARRFAQGFDTWDQTMTRSERNRPGFAERDARATTDAALAWAQADAKQPWFLWLHYQDPHGPYDPPSAPPIQEQAGAPRLPLLDDQSGRGGIPKYQALPGARTQAAYERRYLDEIRWLDAELARLIARLDALGEPPVVLLTADHGEAFGEDGYFFAHGHSLGLDQIRVPLLLRPRSSTQTSLEPRPVSLLSLAPTLLAAAGVPAPASFRGSALPLSPDTAWDTAPFFAEHPEQAAVVVGSRYYARSREPGAAQPARVAELPAGGRLPAPATGSAAPDLESALSKFLSARPGEPSRAVVSDTIREHLRALGYAD